MKKRKNRKNIVIILASLLIFALAVSLAYFNDYKDFTNQADTDDLGFRAIETKEEDLTLMAPGDARFLSYQVDNVKGLAMDVRAIFEMEDLSNVNSQTGGFSVYDAADVLGYNYD
ncbi:MAG: hypothetical protein GX819_00475, partial [Clostridiaceae bacterium]|nr:hypothetical protein [Clostridiaceae bacterium]